MKFGLILTGAVLAFGAVLPGAAVQAAPQGTIVLADDNHDHDKQNGQQGQTPPQGNKGGSNQTGSHDHKSNQSMGGQNNMGGQNTMGGQNMMMMGGHNQTTGNNQKGRTPYVKGTPRKSFNRQTYQRNFTAPRHYHIGSYHRPHGWYSHHWVFGDILPALFWTQQYWISDYYDYGLADPPDGYVWVRDGDDALLVDSDSGEILQVEYDVFD
jgi:Ni/Co efflux regulator RcnB